MTNREKYIDNASNGAIANKLAYERVCGFCTQKNKCDRKDYGANCEANKINWLNSKADMSADEMFENLGYKFHSKQASDIVYINKIEKYKKYDIKIRIMLFGNGYIKSATQGTSQYLLWITEEEDKAIHKKIEELNEANGKNS